VTPTVTRSTAMTRARREHEGDIESFSLWAGQGVGLVTREQSAAEIVAELVADARAVLLAGAELAGC
jgi:NAD(P)H-dependent flavin oxidoreductase YrpB (nitropropane dioxygenase family)